MIREMKHDFEGIEFYSSTFNLTTGDLVRVTEEPSTPRYTGYSSSADLNDVQDFIRHHLDKRTGKRDYEGFRKRWEAKYGPRIWRRRSWSPSPETIDIKINDWCDFGCKYCVPSGTMILTPNGNVPIENIKVNDAVYAFQHANEKTNYPDNRLGQRVEDSVAQTFERDYSGEIISIQLENGKTLELTSEHEVYTQNRGYIKAAELTEEDDLVSF